MTTILAVVASPHVGGRTTAAVQTLLAAAREAGTVSLVELAATTTDDVLAAMAASDAIVFGTPVYRAGHTALLRSLLESTQRGMYGETSAPLRGKATAIVMTGADDYHYLATDGLRAVLANFFATQVLSPALYLGGTAFNPDTTLTAEAAQLAATHGGALVELATAVHQSALLSTMDPQI